MTPNKGVLTIHWWRTEKPTSETFEGVHDVRVKGAFLVVRQETTKRKLVQVLMFPADRIDSVEFDERATYVDVFDEE